MMENSQIYTITCSVYTQDYINIREAINQGIDSRLTGFIKSAFEYKADRLICHFHISELEILIRRLLELDNESAEWLADDIVTMYYQVDII